MIPIAPAQFTLGCQQGDDNCESDEIPHQVKIPSFFVSKYPITNKQYAVFLNAQHQHKSITGKHWVQVKAEDSDSHLVLKQGVYLVEPRFEQFPVIEVSWVGAVKYAQWLSSITHKHYHLPTEDQWEAMARANYDISCIDNSRCRTVKQLLMQRQALQPVGSGMSNALGVSDLLVNNWEWTCSNYKQADVASRSVCSQSSLWDSHRSIKGCSWQSNFWECRFSNRAHQDVWYQNHQTSFRLVRENK